MERMRRMIQIMRDFEGLCFVKGGDGDGVVR